MEPIPKIIHLICAGKQPPEKYALFVERMQWMHPSWTIKIWDDETALSVVSMHFPEWVETYMAYPLPVQRADIFRIMITYLQGGFYLDLDMFCFKPLDELCKHEAVLGIEKILSQDECLRLNHRYPVRIANYMFGSKPGHALWTDFLQAAKNKSVNGIASENDVLEITGPGLLTNVVHETKDKYPNIVLLENKEGVCLKSCGPASCHYGVYAVHYHAGSWRWEHE